MCSAVNLMYGLVRFKVKSNHFCILQTDVGDHLVNFFRYTLCVFFLHVCWLFISPPGNDSFRSTHVLLQMFFIYFLPRYLRVPQADAAKFCTVVCTRVNFENQVQTFEASPQKILGAINVQNLARFHTTSYSTANMSETDEEVRSRTSTPSTVFGEKSPVNFGPLVTF